MNKTIKFSKLDEKEKKQNVRLQEARFKEKKCIKEIMNSVNENFLQLLIILNDSIF